jgi:hypothetical protein
MANIFISYAREDENPALEIYEILLSEGFSVWIDQKKLMAGQDWKTEIETAIKECDIFIACLSNHSVNKVGFVQAELKRALEVADLMPEGRIFIIPVRLDDCKLPTKLADLHWLNYFEAGSKEKLFKAIQGKINVQETLEADLNEFLMRNNPELLRERFAGVSPLKLSKSLLSIANREDEILSVRRRAVRGLSLLGVLDNSVWSELIAKASTELLADWIANWGEDSDSTVLDAEHIRIMLESRRLPKSSTGLGKAVKKFIQRGAGYTSAVLLPGSKYPAWEVKYDCVRTIISLDDVDTMRVLASFSTMSYWKARRRMVEYIEGKYKFGALTSENLNIAIEILRQIVNDGKTEDKTPTMRVAQELLEKMTDKTG